MDGSLSRIHYKAFKHLFTPRSTSYKNMRSKVLGMHNIVKDVELGFK